MMARKKQAPSPLPLTILTGFLGSGKTTLLNWVLKHKSFSNAVVIINEFGDVGLDHLFVETSDEQMIEMSSGCLCCTIRGDLSDALEKLLRDRDNNRIKKFDRVIIETTGLADPAPVLQTLIGHPYFLKRFTLNSMIATIDAQHGVSTIERHPEALKQAVMADVLVVTKTDLKVLTDHHMEALENKLDELNKTALRVHPRQSSLLKAFLDVKAYRVNKDNPDIEAWLYGDHHHDHPHDTHDINRHSDQIQSFSFTYDKSIDGKQFDLFLELLRANFGAQLLRFKGLVKIRQHEDRPVVSHGVQHVFYPPEILDSWPTDDTRTRIVCITDGVQKGKIEALFRAFAGDISQAVQAELFEGDNPLSLRRGNGLFQREE